ncbi:hypothetical protein ACMFMF_009837 [Clarireedia jacksonii]
MPPSPSFSSPPPAYINDTLNGQREEHPVSVTSTVDTRNRVDVESTVSAAGPSTAVTTSSVSGHDKLVSKLEQVIQALESKDEKPSQEDKLISRLENVIRRIGDTGISEGKQDTRKPIKLKDAVGRKFSFPYYRCETWAGIEELIKQAFLHVEILGPHVNEGHYDLMNPAGEVILPQLWEDHVEPGWSISMSMWPMPSPNPRPPPPPVHVIVDRGPPPPPPLLSPRLPPSPPEYIRRSACSRHHASDFDSFTSEKKGIRGLWRKITGVFKRRSKDYDSDSSSSLTDD